jgi:hypothetical protein
MKTRALCLFVFLAAAAAFAQTKPAELEQLQPFVGTWQCKGTYFKSDFGPEHPFTATIATKWTLEGYWTTTDYKETKTAKNPTPLRGVAYWTYDAAAKKFAGSWADNMGSYEPMTSDGWSGDAMSWTGTMSAGGMTFTARDTFTKKSAHQIDHVFDMQGKSGEWTKIEEDTCRRG